MPTAWNALRYSDPTQAEGSTEARQNEWLAEWLAKHPDFTPGEQFIGRGESAFHGENLAEGGSLRQFLDLMSEKNSPVKRGDALVVEFQNRLCRIEPMQAIDLIHAITRKGITIATRFGDITREGLNTGQGFMVLGQAQADFQQSATKSKWTRAGWRLKRRTAKTQPMPHWLTADGKPIDEHVASIKKLVELAIGSGMGASQLLTYARANLPPIARERGCRKTKTKKPAKWTLAYISCLLSDRRLIGEMTEREWRQPVDEDGNVIPGKPKPFKTKVVPNYFPVVLDVDTFARLTAAVQERNHQGKESRNHVNVFARLVTGWRVQVQIDRRNGKCVDRKYLRSTAGINQDGPRQQIDYTRFEKAVLRFIVELTPADLYPAENIASIVASLEVDLAKTDNLIADYKAKMSDPDLLGLYDDAFKSATAKRKKIAGQIDCERAKTPANHVHAEIRTLADITDEGARGRLKAAVGRLIDHIDIRLHGKHAWCHVHFLSGRNRFICVDSLGSSYCRINETDLARFGLPSTSNVRGIFHPDNDEDTNAKLALMLTDLVQTPAIRVTSRVG